MEKLQNRWVIDKDCLSIALDHFYVKITCPSEEEELEYKLHAIHTSKAIIGYSFDSLGDAMYFTEHSIAKCKEVYDLYDEYREKVILKEEKENEDEDDFSEELDYSYVFKKNNKLNR